MEDHNSVLENSVMQYLEDMQKSLCDNNANYSSEHHRILTPPKSPQLNQYPGEFNCEAYSGVAPSLFDQEMESVYRDAYRYEMADESKNNRPSSNKEEFKEENEYYRKTVRAHVKSEAKCNNDGESQSESKHVLTNKERARIARKRKKQYYDDLEDRNKYLENKLKELTDELDQYKSKTLTGDGYPPPKELKLDKPTPPVVSNDCIKMLRNWPEESHVFQICNKMSESCRPFGTNKLGKLDKAFDSITENMFCSGTQMFLYAIDKDVPKTRAEYESYSKLGKFQRHDKYPDPAVRQFIETTLAFNFTNDQYQDFFVNHMTQMAQFKTEVKEALSVLFDARFRIYKAIMRHDLIKTKMTLKTISKSQLMNLANNYGKNDVTVSWDQIFDIKRKQVEVERTIGIPDPKAFAKASIHGVEKSENGELPSCVSDIYQTTLFTCDSK